jgi:hypothetical protein
MTGTAWGGKYPPQTTQPGNSPVPSRKTGFSSLLDSFLNSDNPFVATARRMALGPVAAPLEQYSVPLIQKAADYMTSDEMMAKAMTPDTVGLASVLRTTKDMPESDNAAVEAVKAGAGIAHKAAVTPAIKAMEASEAIWNYSTRPVKTGLLLGTQDSPLYQKGTVDTVDETTGEVIKNPTEAGFQLSDVGLAFERADELTLAQAAAPSTLAQAIPGALSTNVYAILTGVNDYDPWSVESMEAAQEDPFYVAMTGGTDIALQMALPVGVRAIRIAGMKKVGLTNTVVGQRTLDGIRADIDDHLAGRRTTAHGEMVDRIATESNPTRIREESFVANAHGADKGQLSNLLSIVKDREMVKEIALANLGDMRAINTLAANAPDTIWTLGNGTALVRSNHRLGKPYRPTGSELQKANATFDTAMQRDKAYQMARDQFTQPTAEGRVATINSSWRLTDSVAVERIRADLNRVRYAQKSGDWKDITTGGSWVERQFGKVLGSAPVTSRLQWVGSRMPLGHVTRSGARPDEIIAERNAQFDSLPFLRGNRPLTVETTDVFDGKQFKRIEETTADQWRMKQTQRLLNADNRMLQAEWEAIDNEVVRMMADELGIGREQADKIVTGVRSRIASDMDYLRESGGYIYDSAGKRIHLEPQTARQLLNSFQTLPLADIYRAMQEEAILLRTDRAAGLTGRPGWAALKGQDVGIDLFDVVQKVFRTNVLFRPGYTGKNAFLEPLLSSYLAHGTILADEGILATMSNFTTNRFKDIKRVAYMANLDTYFTKNISNGKVRREMKVLVAQRHDAQEIINSALDELDDIAKMSPAQMAQHRPAVNGIIGSAQDRINAIEAMFDKKAPGWRDIDEPATQAELKVWLSNARNNPGATGLDAKTLADLEADYAAIAAKRRTPGATGILKQVQDLDDKIRRIDMRYGANAEGLRAAQAARRMKIAGVSGASYSRTGQGTFKAWDVDAEDWVEVPGAFNTGAYNFGNGYLAEASAQTTNRLTYDPSYRANYEMGRWQRGMEAKAVDPDNPVYWEELSHSANRIFRGDGLIQQYLEGATYGQLEAWLKSEKGRAYQEAMNRNYLEEIDPTDPLYDPAVANMTNLERVLQTVNAYLPDPAVRRMVAERELSAGELQALLGGRADLQPIGGLELDFGWKGNGARAAAAVSEGLDRVWNWIATQPEDRIARWPFYQREFRYQMERRVALLQEQGYKLTPDQLHAFRQASHREALTELEKTFYNIRRYSTPVYQSRFLMSFPGAFFNSIYRYGRFVTQQPERALQANLLAGDMIRNMGIDENGEPVENLSDAVYFVVPFTGENYDEGTKGLRVRVDAFANLSVNWPSVSWNITAATSLAQRNNPSFSKFVEETLPEPIRNEMFPFGISDNPIGGLFAGYQKDLHSLWKGDADEDFLRTHTWIFADQLARWENAGGMDSDYAQPTWESSYAATEAFYKQSATTKFVQPLSTQISVPGQFLRDQWSALSAARVGVPDEQVRAEFMARYGNAAYWYTVSTTERQVYIEPNEVAYDRVMKDHADLTQRLMSLGEDPEMVSLMGYGTKRFGYSSAIGAALRNDPLPGQLEPVNKYATPDEILRRGNVDRGWDTYLQNKAKYSAERERMVEMRDTVTNEQARDMWKAKINGIDAEWSAWEENLKAAYPQWAVEKTTTSGDRAARAAMYIREMANDAAWMKDVGQTPEWQKLLYFMQQRDNAKAQLASLADNDPKRREIKDGFVAYVQENFVPNDPEFAGTWERYFSSEWE